MTALFELASDFRALADKLNDSEMDQQTIADTLDGASGDLEEKIINTAKYYRNIDADADKIEEAAKAMMARAKTLRTHAGHIKQYLQSNMERAGLQKVNSPWFVVSLAQNPEAVTVDDESLIPRDYFKEIPATFQLDKNLCKQAIKDGFEVPGVRLTRGTSLRIK
jgi:hypothetical protein